MYLIRHVSHSAAITAHDINCNYYSYPLTRGSSLNGLLIFFYLSSDEYDCTESYVFSIEEFFHIEVTFSLQKYFLHIRRHYNFFCVATIFLFSSFYIVALSFFFHNLFNVLNYNVSGTSKKRSIGFFFKLLNNLNWMLH